MAGKPTPGPVRTTDGYGLGDAPADGSALPWSTVVEWLAAGVYVVKPATALVGTEADFPTTATRFAF